MINLPLLPPETIVRILTSLSLGGLLFAVGLRLPPTDVLQALRFGRLALILPVNFVLVPAVAFGFAKGFKLPGELAAGMLLLAAAPFAPVVPVFVRLARGDLALAAGLTGLFPVFCTFLTPFVGQASLDALNYTGSLRFDAIRILILLIATNTLPLLAGMTVRQALPRLAGRVLRPLEAAAEATGALSLIFVVYLEFGAILATGWQPLLAMALAGELTFLLGLATGGQRPAARQVIAFGTANRNIALAILVAVGGMTDPAVLAAVVANGLLLILLGLIHVAGFRLLAAPVQAGRKRPD